jgi:hypothetical protein
VSDQAEDLADDFDEAAEEVQSGGTEAADGLNQKCDDFRRPGARRCAKRGWNRSATRLRAQLRTRTVTG